MRKSPLMLNPGVAWVLITICITKRGEKKMSGQFPSPCETCNCSSYRKQRSYLTCTCSPRGITFSRNLRQIRFRKTHDDGGMITRLKKSQRMCENIRMGFPPGSDLTSGNRRRAADQFRVRKRMRNRGRGILRLGSGLFGFQL